MLQNFSLPAIHLNGAESWHAEALHCIEEMIRINTEQSRTFEIEMIVKLEQFWQLLFLHAVSASEEMPFDKRNYERIRDILSYIETTMLRF